MDLLKRLRAIDTWLISVDAMHEAKLAAHEAAAEIERTTMDRDYWKAAAGMACEEIKRLRAEVEKCPK